LCSAKEAFELQQRERQTMKLKIQIIFTAIVATFGWRVLAQTNVAPVILTNLIRAPDSLRDVNGRLYDINESVLWKTMDGDFLKISTKRIVLSTFTMEPIYQATTVTERMHPDRDYLHASDARNDERLVAKKVQVGDKKVPGKKIILLNYPANLYPADGQTVSFRAMRIGTSDYNGDTLELWDYGTKPTQDELRKYKDQEAERQKAIEREANDEKKAADEWQKAVEKELDDRRRVAAKAVAAKKQAADVHTINWLLTQATNGSASAQCSLGLRYLKGEGVPKDEKQAREWLEKAATQGSDEAATVISKLNRASTNSPAIQ
jgi:hypothetical protein